MRMPFSGTNARMTPAARPIAQAVNRSAEMKSTMPAAVVPASNTRNASQISHAKPWGVRVGQSPTSAAVIAAGMLQTPRAC